MVLLDSWMCRCNPPSGLYSCQMHRATIMLIMTSKPYGESALAWLSMHPTTTVSSHLLHALDFDFMHTFPLPHMKSWCFWCTSSIPDASLFSVIILTAISQSGPPAAHASGSVPVRNVSASVFSTACLVLPVCC